MSKISTKNILKKIFKGKTEIKVKKKVIKTKKVKYKANIGLLRRAKQTVNAPIVAIGGINSKNYKKLLLNNANFLAISSYIWNNKKLKPIEAVKKLK